MAVTSYSGLKTAIADWLGRSDLTSDIDDFIDLAEAHFNTEIRCREMEAVSDLSPTSNVYTLPTDYLEYRRVVEKASYRRDLEYITPGVVEAAYPDRESGLSSHFTIIGSSLYTFPLSDNDVELTYYQKIPALSDGNTTNWLLDRLPNLYLHASLMNAAEFARNSAAVAREAEFVKAYIEQLSTLDTRANLSNAGMYLEGPTP